MAAIALVPPRARTSFDGVTAVLRFEGIALVVAALFFYAHRDFSWALFAALFLAPDLSFAAYLFDSRTGALAYNIMHSTLGPLCLGTFGVMLTQPIALAIAAIWFAHIGFDRALGYGLKYSDSFSHTHLGPIGRRDSNAEDAEDLQRAR
jgi:uncharacterized protein DUF4260